MGIDHGKQWTKQQGFSIYSTLWRTLPPQTLDIARLVAFLWYWVSFPAPNKLWSAPAFGRLKQEDKTFKIILSYRAQTLQRLRKKRKKGRGGDGRRKGEKGVEEKENFKLQFKALSGRNQYVLLCYVVSIWHGVVIYLLVDSSKDGWSPSRWEQLYFLE